MEETAANLQHGYAPYGSDRQTDVPQKRDKRVKINAKGASCNLDFSAPTLSKMKPALVFLALSSVAQASTWNYRDFISVDNVNQSTSKSNFFKSL